MKETDQGVVSKILFTTTNSQDGIDGAYWQVRYCTSVLEPGKTKVEWELYKGGRSSSPTYLATTIKFYINDQLVYAPSRIFTDPNESGTNHPHCGYADKHNITPTTSGNFEVEHDSEGKGSFTMQIEAAIYTITMRSGEVCTFDLDKNMPQTPCYWSNDSKIWLDRTYIAPGHLFTVNWTGANNGIGNDIKEFQIEYKVGNITDGPFVVEDTGTNSFYIELSEEAQRGENIEVSIKIIESTSLSSFAPIISNNSSIVNPKLGELTINSYTGMDTDNIFKCKLDEVQFQFSLPKKNTSQSVEIRYQVDNEENINSINSSLLEYSIGDWEMGTAKTFTFWASDGEENSSNQIIILTRNDNRANEVDLEYKNYIFTATIPDGCTGELQLYDNGALQKVVPVVNMEKVDIRTLLEKTWKSGATYAGLIGRLVCTYRVDEAYKETSLSISVPEITVIGRVEGFERYCLDGDANTILVTIEKDGSDAWEFSGELEQIGQGQKLNRIKMKGGFYADPSSTVTTIKDLKLDFSTKDDKYKPYSQDLILSSPFEGKEWEKYGLTKEPEFSFWFYETSVSNPIIKASFSSDNTISYTIDGKQGYNISSALFPGGWHYLSYSYKDIYGREIIQTATKPIELDFREKAKRSNNGESWYICAIPSGESWNSNYAIENWNCIKESMILNTNFEIAATTLPKAAWLERSNDEISWTRFCDFSLEQKGEDYNTQAFNTPVPIYLLKSALVGEITLGSKDYIRLVVQTDEMELLTEQYRINSFMFAQHVEPLIKFTKVSYSSSTENTGEGIISADYSILSQGSNLQTKNSFYCYIKETNTQVQDENPDQAAKKLVFSYTISDTFVNVAPILSTSLSAINPNFSEPMFTTMKSTSINSYEYSICYNISPTIAYRPNYLGINTGAPAGVNVLLDINAYNNQEIIYFRHSTGIASVDLSTMGMSGFVVDCGSWTNIPGGIIPSGELPTGLAQIAYTGEIADLEQERSDIIIVSGGTANEQI